MWRSLRSYFVHYRGERNGAIVVAIIILVVIVTVELVPWRKLRDEPKIPQVIFIVPDEDSAAVGIASDHELFDFNPNTLSDSGFRQLGFSDKEIKTLRNYQKAGGSFRLKRDVAKLYFIDEEEYARLEPFIALPSNYERVERRKGSRDGRRSEPRVPRELFTFDPNTLSDSGFGRLGFSQREIATLRKYQEKGGRFSKKEDFSKLYFVSDDEYAALEAYIEIAPDTTRRPDRYDGEKKRREVDINLSDTVELKSVRGIGSYFAREIVSLREELGGYYSLDQLIDIYGMTPERIAELENRLKVSSEAVRKINLNTATVHDLARHPYIDFKTANKLVGWREKRGRVSALDLEQSGLLDAELYRKFAPYLEYD